MRYATGLIVSFLTWTTVALAEVPLSAVRTADVVFVGETHDNPDHHATQAKLAALAEPAAIVFEMLTPEQAARVTDDVRADAETLAAALEWDASGWPDFAMYFPIFAEAPQAKIFGALVPRAQAKLVLDSDLATVFGDEAAAYGLTSPLPEDQQGAREALQDAAHCGALPAEVLPGMVEIQRLRDAVLARAIMQAIADTGGPVMVITGNGHARRDWGAPQYLAQVAPNLRLISVGQGEEGTPPEGGFDWILDAPAPEREDPCAAFK